MLHEAAMGSTRKSPKVTLTLGLGALDPGPGFHNFPRSVIGKFCEVLLEALGEVSIAPVILCLIYPGRSRGKHFAGDAQAFCRNLETENRVGCVIHIIQ